MRFVVSGNSSPWRQLIFLVFPSEGEYIETFLEFFPLGKESVFCLYVRTARDDASQDLDRTFLEDIRCRQALLTALPAFLGYKTLAAAVLTDSV